MILGNVTFITTAATAFGRNVYGAQQARVAPVFGAENEVDYRTARITEGSMLDGRNSGELQE